MSLLAYENIHFTLQINWYAHKSTINILLLKLNCISLQRNYSKTFLVLLLEVVHDVVMMNQLIISPFLSLPCRLPR
jgi:hypothetical protein